MQGLLILVRNALIGSHFFTYVETIAKMDVNYIEILIFEVHLLQGKSIDEFLVRNVVKRTCWRFKERSNFRLFPI